MVIDCLFIGYNEMYFSTYADLVYGMGKESPVYRDLQTSFIWHEGERKTVTDVFNTFVTDNFKFRMGNEISTTLSYLATFLNKNSLSYGFIHDFQKEMERLKELLLAEGEVLTIAITTTFYTNPSPIIEICQFIRKFNKKVKIIIGGPYIFNLYYSSGNDKSLKLFLKNTNADILITNSQGEHALVEVIRAIKEGGTLQNISNLTYREGIDIKSNMFEPENNSLDDNVIDWRLFKGSIGNTVAVRTCLSCPFCCSFCGFNQRAGKYILSDIKTVERELDVLHELGINSINFIDDTFNYPVDRFKDIMRMMIRKQYKFKWNSYFRCQFADKEMIDLMVESGCEAVYLGIESGSQKILNNMKKGASLSQYHQGITLLKQAGILIHANFILGFVGEDSETIKETIAFIKKYKPDFFRVQPWYVDPVTPIWKERDKYGIKGSNFLWSHDTMTSREACDWIEKIIMDEEIESVWLPVHNFNFHNLFRLINNGIEVNNIKGFLRGFTKGIRESLLHPDKKDISVGILEEIRSYLQ